MNVKDLIEVGQKAVLNQTGDIVSKEKLNIALNAIFQAIKEVSSVEDVTIYRFGTFSRKNVGDAIISTQFTKKLPNGVAEIPAHITPKFRPSKEWKNSFRYGDNG
jgi:nucleoid DNA-binding protein